MSLGGMSSIALAAHAPELVRALVLVDVTPGVNEEKAAPITNFINGPASFDSFDELLARTIEHNPGRSESSLRRGILHNAVQREDGTWVWRYARFRSESTSVPQFGDWWESISKLSVPVMLVRGLAWSVVDDADVDELLKRQPGARVEGVEGAGHSIQGDRPLELADLIDDFVFGPRGTEADGGRARAPPPRSAGPPPRSGFPGAPSRCTASSSSSCRGSWPCVSGSCIGRSTGTSSAGPTSSSGPSSPATPSTCGGGRPRAAGRDGRRALWGH